MNFFDLDKGIDASKISKISVVLPVYNGAVYLKDSIKSVLNQTHRDFELIIIDDCSTDRSGIIAKHYASLDPRVFYYCNDMNLKLPRALNVGFAQATGAYFTWTSCDNLYLPNAFERMLLALKEDETAGLVYASMSIIDGEGKEIDFMPAAPSEHILSRNVVRACFLYKRSVADHVGPYDPEAFLWEDHDYWLRIAKSYPIKPIDECLYQYRRHEDSLSYKYKKEASMQGIRIKKKYYPFFVKTRRDAATFYKDMLESDLCNPHRRFYLLRILFYEPSYFYEAMARVYRWLKRCIKK